MDKNELACYVEEFVCKHTGLPLNRLFEPTKKGDCIKARHLSIFILHTIYNIPISFLSNRYKCSPRHIFRAVAQVRDYAKTNRPYRESLEFMLDTIMKATK